MSSDQPNPSETAPDNLDDIFEPPQDIAPKDAIEALENGELTLHGLLPWSSNYAFLGTVTHNTLKFNFVYKPCKGERPLWDFEQGTLCKREVAAYLMSRALGDWVSIPPTVYRKASLGWGSLQQFIHADYEIHYFTLKDDPEYQPVFKKLALFDYLVNNADRKGGHCLLDHQGKLWAIDHGLAFHTDYKLRTVIWEYANQSIAPEALKALETFRNTFTPVSSSYLALSQLISPAEIEGFLHRLDNLLTSKKFPRPLGMRDYPYPPV